MTALLDMADRWEAKAEEKRTLSLNSIDPVRAALFGLQSQTLTLCARELRKAIEASPKGGPCETCKFAREQYTWEEDTQRRACFWCECHGHVRDGFGCFDHEPKEPK